MKANERIFYDIDHIEYIYDDLENECTVRELIKPYEASTLRASWGLVETVRGFNGQKAIWKIEA